VGDPPGQALALRQRRSRPESALEAETAAQSICFNTENAKEGIRAFVEKRDPLFRGR